MNSNGSILIIDSDEANRTTLRQILQPLDYHLAFVATGAEALTWTATHTVDLIILNFRLPKMNGFTICQSLRSSFRTTDIPILMMMHPEDQESRARGLPLGIDDFVIQPIDPIELQTRVKSLTRLSQYQSLLADARTAEQQARQIAHELTLAYDSTLEVWARALDMRDQEPIGHTSRVTALTVRLAHAVDVPAADIAHIRRGALLHDVGKVRIPDSILLKRDTLTEKEWQIMRKHPVYAYELLKSINFLGPALDIPHYHHEKWDGTGYPEGLRNSEIPLAARIFAVVDVWDVMTHDRPYRAAFSSDIVREHIQSLSGSHFDPQVVDIFLNVCLRGTPTATGTVKDLQDSGADNNLL